MTKIYNITSGKQKRQTLRNETPPAEQRLWARLRGRQMLGFKFRRQYSVDHYVIDFYCPRVKLAIEVDGDSHFQDAAEDYDAQRQQYIEALGIRFLRFTNREVYERLDDVLEVILRILREMDSSSLPTQTTPSQIKDTPSPTLPLAKGEEARVSPVLFSKEEKTGSFSITQQWQEKVSPLARGRFRGGKR